MRSCPGNAPRSRGSKHSADSRGTSTLVRDTWALNKETLEYDVGPLFPSWAPGLSCTVLRTRRPRTRKVVLLKRNATRGGMRSVRIACVGLAVPRSIRLLMIVACANGSLLERPERSRPPAQTDADAPRVVRNARGNVCVGADAAKARATTERSIWLRRFPPHFPAYPGSH